MAIHGIRGEVLPSSSSPISATSIALTSSSSSSTRQRQNHPSWEWLDGCSFTCAPFIGPQISGRLKHRCLLFCQKQLAILHTSWLVVLPLFLMFWLHLNVFFNFSAVKKDFSSFWLVFIPCFFVVTNFDSFYNFWSGFPSLDQNIHLCMMAQSRALPM